ncbi:MAG: hypothetical protein U9R25_15085 [Chloroflexota bacterium]|nr:hypothetical protein [Chloroflexota bacterium]
MQNIRDSLQAIVARDAISGKEPGTAARAKTGASQKRISWRAIFGLGLIFLIMVVLLQADWRPRRSPLDRGIDALTDGQRFDLVRWEAEAISGKLTSVFRNSNEALTEEEERALVRGYLVDARRIGQLEDAIDEILSDPQGVDPIAATEQARAEVAELRERLEERATEVETILETQLAREIRALGLTTVGTGWPPPKLSFTEPPKLLVLSPRDRIERIRSVDLVSDLDNTDRETLEQAVAEQFDMVAYVTGIGGYGAWPAMIVNRFGLPWTTETIAHEWVHNYLAFHPLGWSFLQGGDAVTMNETVASIVGEELGLAVIETNYPELLPPPPVPSGEVPDPQDGTEPDEFDFRQEMRATRLVVDEFLAQGLVEEAEAFMEARRLTFVEHGYPLRVLNQAYFAFHGSYGTSPAATDPIGPKMERLRQLSPSLQAFLRLVDGLVDLEDLDAALERLEGTAGEDSGA